MPCTWLKLPGGGVAIVKHAAPKRKRCEFCKAWAGFQCDGEVAKGKTCDAHLCETHAHPDGPDRHLCPCCFGGAPF